MESEWEIRARAHECARSREPFTEGDIIYTLLFRDRYGFRREDISEAVWLKTRDLVTPFSFWKSRYEPPPPRAPEPLPKESGEMLLRKLLQADRPDQTKARYVLAIMLERKKVLKEVDVRESDGSRYLIYEHVKTGEVFIIEDPRLNLGQLDLVQSEVYALLADQNRDRQPSVAEEGQI